jgi:hypothetical protein
MRKKKSGINMRNKSGRRKRKMIRRISRHKRKHGRREEVL